MTRVLLIFSFPLPGFSARVISFVHVLGTYEADAQHLYAYHDYLRRRYFVYICTVAAAQSIGEQVLRRTPCFAFPLSMITSPSPAREFCPRHACSCLKQISCFRYQSILCALRDTRSAPRARYGVVGSARTTRQTVIVCSHVVFACFACHTDV